MTVLIEIGGEYFNPDHIVSILPYSDDGGTTVVFAAIQSGYHSSEAYTLYWRNTSVEEFIGLLQTNPRVVLGEITANPDDLR